VHNDSVIAALEAIAPYPNPDGSTPIMKVLTERRWDVALGGMLYGKTKDDEGPIREMSPASRAPTIG